MGYGPSNAGARMFQKHQLYFHGSSKADRTIVERKIRDGDIPPGNSSSLHHCRDGQQTQMVDHPTKKGLRVCPRCHPHLFKN